MIDSHRLSIVEAISHQFWRIHSMKNIFDYNHVKSVSASVLLDSKGEIAGKIIANFSDNSNGSVCTAQVIIYKLPDTVKPKIKRYDSEFLKDDTFESPFIGKASGYGYDKLSTAIANAIRDNTTKCPPIDFDGVGEGKTIAWFKEHLNLDLHKII